MQAVYASIFDYYLLKFSDLCFGKKYHFLVMIANYFNWYSLFALIRTIVNSFEATLFLVAIYHWKLSKSLEPNEKKKQKKFLIFSPFFK